MTNYGRYVSVCCFTFDLVTINLLTPVNLRCCLQIVLYVSCHVRWFEVFS